jgi:2-methylcitrate dehydratase
MTVSEKLAEYVNSVDFADLDERVVHEAKRRIIDSYGCAIGAFNAAPVKGAREIAESVISKNPATILGTSHKTSPELAAFTNTTMSRYLDFMDTYFFKGEIVHPEDNIASLVAVAESEKRDGKDLILSIVLAYEIACRFVDFANIRKRGWDHVIWDTIATSASASRLMGLSEPEAANAISIGVSSNIPLRNIRVGKLSVWKCPAVSYATMAGIFSCRLARSGITGPEEVFEGKMGFFDQVTGKSGLNIGKFAKHGKGFKIMEVHLKKYPAEINSQSAIDAALKIRKEVNDISSISRVKIETFTTAYEIIADKAKWYPKNRETADHSLPYIVCAALTDGEITERQFTTKKINDPEIRRLLRKTTVRATKECDREYCPGMPNKVTAFTKSGKSYTAKVVHHRGSYRNPMSDAEVEEKFMGIVKKYLADRQAEKGLNALWNMEKQKNIGKVLANFIVNR